MVTEEDGEAWARAKGMLFLEASAKTKQGIEQVFEEVAYKVTSKHLLSAYIMCSCCTLRTWRTLSLTLQCVLVVVIMVLMCFDRSWTTQDWSVTQHLHLRSAQAMLG